MLHKQFVPQSLRIALFSLALAAAAGLLLRFGLVWGMPAWAANYTAIRHAHSHLMYFGWVTLAVMALIWHYLPQLTGRTLPRGVSIQLVASGLLALLSFPAFWANGYGITTFTLGDSIVDLPLGSIAAGLNGMGWLVFAGLYLRATWGLPVRSLPIQLWDWAIILLVIAFGGACGLVGLIVTDSANFALQQTFLHLFLDLFAVGWFNLALLGLLWAVIYLAGEGSVRRTRRTTPSPEWLPTQSLATAVVPTFLLGISPALVTPSLFWVAALANLAAAMLLGTHLWALWQRRYQLPMLAHFGLLVLAVHAISALVLLWPGFWQWSGSTQLRIFFLHNLLLGWISSTLLGIVITLVRVPTRRTEQTVALLWSGGVVLLLLALLGVGLIRFVPFTVPTLFRVAAWSSILPTGIALWAWSRSWGWGQHQATEASPYVDGGIVSDTGAT